MHIVNYNKGDQCAMVNEKDDKPLNLEAIDKWLENFFLDPLTSYLDETAFRIDLFETADEFIVEALLTDYTAEEVSVYLKEDKMMIQAGMQQLKQKNIPKLRIIPFPFSVIHHYVKAHFDGGILEVFISKTSACKGKNRVILPTK